MIKLALAIGFLAVFGFTAYAITMKIIASNKNPKDLKRKNGKH
jgi:hypothetical protein